MIKHCNFILCNYSSRIHLIDVIELPKLTFIIFFCLNSECNCRYTLCGTYFSFNEIQREMQLSYFLSYLHFLPSDDIKSLTLRGLIFGKVCVYLYALTKIDVYLSPSFIWYICSFSSYSDFCCSKFYMQLRSHLFLTLDALNSTQIANGHGGYHEIYPSFLPRGITLF